MLIYSIDYEDPTKDCPSEFCVCIDKQSDPNFIACEAGVKTVYNTCVSLCEPGDFICFAACNREYDACLSDCSVLFAK